jgi:hypothetical protein
MRRSLFAPSLRVLALLVLLATLVTLAMAMAPSRSPATSHRAEPGGPFCCGGSYGVQQV